MKQLSHLDEQGRVQMVDVSSKASTFRRATARGRLSLQAATLKAIQNRAVPKGEVLAVARVAGIQAAKQTDRLIPLCHSLPLTHTGVDFAFPPSPDPQRATIEIEATATTLAPTGVEMEALCAVAAAALTLYDMCKGVDSTMRIEEILLLQKSAQEAE